MPAPRQLPPQSANSELLTERILKDCQQSSVSGQKMRVRITKPLSGSIDGIQLSRLSKGHVYDVYTSLACYLLTEGMAEPAPDDDPIAVLPIENQTFHRPIETRQGIILPRSLAAERARKNAVRAPKKKKES
jgi:hypothetical protein